MIADPFDVVMVPFPFSDRAQAKLRPALVLSSREFNIEAGSTVLAMITSGKNSRWPGDVPLDRRAAGLPRPFLARFRILTLDNRLMTGVLGRLSEVDRANWSEQVCVFFSHFGFDLEVVPQ